MRKPKKTQQDSGKMLSDSSDNEEEIYQLTINDHYAKAYQSRKEREELQKLKDKYGSDFDEEEGSDESTDSESAESEDEDGQELTPAVDAAILRTLAMIKRKHPAIYVPGKDVYNEEEQRLANPSSHQRKKDKDKSKPITLRQVALEAVLEGESRSPSPELERPTHVEEQQFLRDETIAAFHGAIAGEDEDEDESDEGGGLLVPREKTKDELEREEEEYRAFLEKEVGSDLRDLITVEKTNDGVAQAENSDIEGDAKKKKKTKRGKESKTKSKEQEDHEFLMNYILNRGWIDKSSEHIPTYKEVTSSKKSQSKSKPKFSAAPSSESDSKAAPGGSEEDESGLDSDTSFENLNDHFEASYNFRFEEPGAATIQAFPRDLPNTVRRQESTRKDARTRKRERKEAELERKREEVRRLKNLKMKEIKKKLEKIGKEGGRGKNVDEDQALQQLDLDAEWDPDEHDKQMTGLYASDADAAVDEEKPTWEDDIDIGDIHVSGDEQPDGSKKGKKKKKKKKNEDDVDEGGVDIDEMDADVVRDNDDEEEWDGTEEMRKRKLKEYMSELDGLDFNDVVAGMKTRFRYTPVKPETFALTPVEILMATDQELNQYVGIKKYAPYRRDAQWDKNRNEKLRDLKKQIAERVGRSGIGAGDSEVHGAHASKPAKKRKGKKERMKAKAAAEVVESGAEDEKQSGKRKHEDEDREADGDQGEEDAGKKKRKRRHKNKSKDAELVPN